jgi:serine/threonine-protein kinase HipA
VAKAFEESTFSENLGAPGAIDPVTLAGVQDKASARMISVPVRQAGRRYILKVDPPELPHVVENEAYFSRHPPGRVTRAGSKGH